MKLLPLVYPTAVQFWTSPTNLNITDRLALGIRKTVGLPAEYRIVSAPGILEKLAKKYGLTVPLRCMVNTAGERRNNGFVSCMIKPKAFLPKSFVFLEQWQRENDKEYLLVAGPELCFLQAAGRLKLYELIKLGYDLCAGYVRDASKEFRQTDRVPVTTIEQIEQYLGQVGQVKGVSKARNAARFVLNHSASPMETTIAILVRLPFSRGGFSVKKPELNPEIRLPAGAAAIMKQETCCCDLVWRTEKVILEYDSNMTHRSPEQHERDLRKTRALERAGYCVQRITADLFRNIDDTERFFSQLRHLLGQNPEKQRIRKTRPARLELMKALRSFDADSPGGHK